MKRQTQPLISIIMPVHNADNFLVQAIESIREQTHTNWEFLCIDDGSTDISPLLLQSFAKFDKRIKVITNKKNRGISYSLNRGIIAAKGEYIARMDADDISLPNRLCEQLKLLESNPALIACGGQAAMIDPVGRIFAYKNFPSDPEVLYKMIMQMVPIQHPMLFTKASTMKQYRYNVSAQTAEDVDMLFYLLSQGKISNVQSVIYKYRKSDMSNGYHNVKQTFLITLATRFSAILKYGYKPSINGLLLTFIQFLVVGVLPSKLIVRAFEVIRYDPPFWKRPFVFATNLFSVRKITTA
jgi:glycosyltransferase involved in cell wall biosynthesis